MLHRSRCPVFVKKYTCFSYGGIDSVISMIPEQKFCVNASEKDRPEPLFLKLVKLLLPIFIEYTERKPVKDFIRLVYPAVAVGIVY